MRKLDPIILYPSLSTDIFNQDGTKPTALLAKPKHFFLSINRYERKKNLDLAIQSFAQLSVEDRSNIRLVMVGGYDSRVDENVEYFTELNQLVAKLKLQDEVEFLKSPSDAEKVWLLKNALCLVYTPTNEHFGIVPLESMYCRTPVIAVDSGGPRETIVNSVTGWLRQPTTEEFSKAMQGVLENREQLYIVGIEGKNRVERYFSFNSFGDKLESSMIDRVGKRRQGRSFLSSLAVAFHFSLALGILYWMIFGMPFP